MRRSDIYIRTNILELDVEVFKKKLFDNYKNTTKYLHDYYYYKI